MEKYNELHFRNVEFEMPVVNRVHIITVGKVQAGDIIWKSSDKSWKHGNDQDHVTKSMQLYKVVIPGFKSQI